MPHPTLDLTVFAARRALLLQRVDGPIILLGNGERARNLPMNKVRFRQDSTFLYFTGCDLPNATAVLERGRFVLYLPVPADDDALWHGHVDTADDLCARFGADEVRPASAAATELEGRTARILAVGDEGRNLEGSTWTGHELQFGVSHGDTDLMDAVIAMRLVKSDIELQAMRAAAAHSAAAHRAVMAATRAGVHERVLAALFEGVLAARGCTTGYGTILTQSGEVLHNFHHDEVLADGRLLLVDGGGELPSGYGADITRTWPVSGTFDGRQRAAYDAVLESQLKAIAVCRPGVRNRVVHDTASLVLARFMADEGLLRVSPETAVEVGAHALFFPHGVGHHLGMDVHDLENFGDRSSYPPDRGRPEQFGTCYLRMDLPLEERWVITVEPGFYAVPAILHDATLRERFSTAVDFEAAEKWLGFGGIRIEDDVVIGPEEPEILSAAVPKTAPELERVVGSGDDVNAALHVA